MGKLSKFGAEKTILDKDGNLVFRRCENDDCTVIKDYTPEQKGFTKDLTVKMIQRKEYFSERSFENKTAYFVITFRCKMPHDRALKYCYFYYEPRAMGNVCIRDFNAEAYSTQTINLFNPETAKYYNIKAISKKRITENQAKAMLRDREVLPQLYNDNGEIGETAIF
jgi:hypothetical protein